MFDSVGALIAEHELPADRPLQEKLHRAPIADTLRDFLQPLVGADRCHGTRSMTIAMPWPTPMHIVQSA